MERYMLNRHFRKQFFPNFGVYKLNGANAMVIESKLRNKEQMVT